MKQTFINTLFSEIKSIFRESAIDKEVVEPIYPGHLLYLIYASMKGKSVFIGEKFEVETLFEDIQFFFPHSSLSIVDEDDIIPASAMIKNGTFDILVVNKDFLNTPVPNVEILKIQRGTEYDRDEIIEKLYSMGYERTDRSIKTGDFSIRGSIVDIFPLNSSQPVRCEFDSETLISLRYFNPLTQISTEHINSAYVSSFYGEDTGISILDKIKPYNIISRENIKSDNLYHLNTKGMDIPFNPMENFQRDFNRLREYLRKTKGKQVFVLLETIMEVERIRELLMDDFPEIGYLEGHLTKGFTLGNLVIITESDIFGSSIPRKLDIVPEKGLTGLSSIERGDYVVHEKFGIGIYDGLKRIRENGQEQEYITVRYQGNDKVYVPIYNMHYVSRYIGSKSPTISSLKTNRWLIKSKRVKEEIKEIAEEMLNLYAKRKAVKGIVMASDTEWQKEMEAMFPYEETEDQIKAIQEIKQDMEKDIPMERLLCGEVGYGKTEVALRAVFKCVMSNFQVAVITPTTILAEQHYNTFKDRLSKFPIDVELLSRFTSRNEKKIIQDIEDGTVDIVVGTHKLLSPDIKFRRLGLLIIDEEQRFGVAQKEKIKQMKTDIDVLSMSATPIPRTLKLAMTGILDLSLIETAPVGRLSVHTEIIHWDKELIREIIRRELDRGGQTYFIHNRIATINSLGEKLRAILPEAKIGIVHGRMASTEIERIMVDFIERKYDILLTTAIIQSGIDIPNVNTILIDNADRFGLADLHQLRGRVGRTTRRGYCYLIIHNRSLNEDARRRLYAIKHYSYLGAGFRIAIEDMNIRGAGNLFGKEQHGNVDAVGYDLYLKLFERTIKELKGEQVLGEKEIKMDIDATLTIPDDFMPSSDDRLYYYKRLAGVQNEEELENMRKGIEDRYGKMPAQVEDLFLWIRIKLFALLWNIDYIRWKKQELYVEFAQIPKREELKRMLKDLTQEIKFFHKEKFSFTITDISPEEIYRIFKDAVSY